MVFVIMGFAHFQKYLNHLRSPYICVTYVTIAQIAEFALQSTSTDIINIKLKKKV